MSGAIVPLTPAQREFAVRERMQPGSCNIELVFDVPDEVQPSVLLDALQRLVRRHDALRCSIALGRGMADLGLGVPVEMTVVEAAGVAAARQVLYGVMREPFRLDQQTAFRAVLIESAGARHLVIVTNHVVVDGWSLGLLCRDLNECYGRALAGQDEPDPAVGWLAFADEFGLDGAAWRRHADEWTDDLAGWSEMPAVTPHREDHLDSSFFAIRDAGAETFRRACRAHRVTPFMLVTHRLCDALASAATTRDLVLWTTVANRQRRFDETVGCFANAVPLCVRLDHTTGAPSFASVRDAVVRAARFGSVPTREILVRAGFSHSRLAALGLPVVVVTSGRSGATVPSQGWFRFSTALAEAGAARNNRDFGMYWDVRADLVAGSRGLGVELSHRRHAADWIDCAVDAWEAGDWCAEPLASTTAMDATSRVGGI